MNISLLKDKAFFVISGNQGSGKTRLANDLIKSLEKKKQRTVTYEDASYVMIHESKLARKKLHEIIQAFTAYRHTGVKVILVTHRYPDRLNFIFNGHPYFKNNTAWLFTFLPNYLYDEFPITVPIGLRTKFYKQFLKAIKRKNHVTRPALIVTKDDQGIVRYHK